MIIYVWLFGSFGFFGGRCVGGFGGGSGGFIFGSFISSGSGIFGFGGSLESLFVVSVLFIGLNIG